jgi:uncharacterized membrane protein YidH (DUF202 family)
MSHARWLSNLANQLDSIMRSRTFLAWLRICLAIQNAQLFWLRHLGLYPSTLRAAHSDSASRRRTN